MKNFDLINFLLQNKILILALLGVGILYFFLNIVFGNGKHEMSDEDDEQTNTIELKEPKDHKSKVGYSKHSSSYYGTTKGYDFIPKDGSSVRINNYSKKRVVKNHTKNDLNEKEKYYNEAFYTKRFPTLSGVAKFMKLSNEQVVDDLKLYRKKNLFLDVSANLTIDQMTYTNGIVDRNESAFYFEEEKVETNQPVDNNGFLQHKCPYCGTDNIIDVKTKKYNCYYCLHEVKI